MVKILLVIVIKDDDKKPFLMLHTVKLEPAHNIPWFQRWFDSVYYHKLYNNRNEQEAADFVDRLVSYLRPTAGCSMLDLGCGTGRHARQLAAKGFHVTGIDLSSYSIRLAGKFETESLRFLRRDMRDPFGSAHFHNVFNFFTSFGYFKTKQENDVVINNIANALKDDGMLVMDYMNARFHEERLVSSEDKDIDGIHYHIERWIDTEFIYKKITIDTEQIGEPFENVEQVARFTMNDFREMFSGNRMQLEAVFGDYHLSDFDLDSSPRMIMIAKKTS